MRNLILIMASLFILSISGTSVLAEEVEEATEEVQEVTEENVEEVVGEETTGEEVIKEVVEETTIEEVTEDTTTEEDTEEVETVINSEEEIIEEVVEKINIEEVKVVEEVVNEEAKMVLTSKKSTPSAKNVGINGFVTRLYRNVLDREPDNKGFNYWANGIKNKSITGSNAVKGFFLSKEMNNKGLSNAAFVKELYKTIFNREADKAGLDYWTKRLNVKMSRESVVNGFIESKEFANLCKSYGVNKGSAGKTNNYRDKSYDVTAFVDRMYTKVLNRSSDVNGVDYWCKKLLTKESTGADITEGFLNSKEFNNKRVSNKEYVNVAYRTILDREADSKGRSYWVNKLNSGSTKREVLKGFVESKEFTNLCGKYNISRGNIYTRKDIVDMARSWIGKVKYVMGGDDPHTGADCSGFVNYIYKQIGMDIPRYTGALYPYCIKIDEKDAKPGDLILWTGHASIYSGNNMSIHCIEIGVVEKENGSVIGAGQYLGYYRVPGIKE